MEQLSAKLEEQYKQYYKVPAITVTPLVVNSKLNDLVSSVDARYGQGGLIRQARVTPAVIALLSASVTVMAALRPVW